LAPEIIPLFLALEIICFLFQAFDVFGGIITYPLGDMSNLTTLQGFFSITPFSALVGGSAIVLGIAALLLRQNTYAIYACFIFGFGIVFTGISQIVLAVPNIIGALLNMVPAINPTPGGVNPFSFVIIVIVGYAMFWFLAALVMQRDV
jgi:hypothetical protein